MGVTVVVDDVNVCWSNCNVLVVFEDSDHCGVHHHEAIVIEVLNVFFLLRRVTGLCGLLLLLLIKVLFFF